VIGGPESERIVGTSCYFLDPKTGLADVAYMVDAEWQGSGLGTLLQARTIDYARRHGVRGFTADVLVYNAAMLAVFRRSGCRVESRLIGGAYEVEILFDEPPPTGRPSGCAPPSGSNSGTKEGRQTDQSPRPARRSRWPVARITHRKRPCMADESRKERWMKTYRGINRLYASDVDGGGVRSGRASRRRRVALIVFILSAGFAALPSGSATAADSAITGVWSCQHARPGNPVSRPLTFVFHTDGTLAYSSQSTVSGGPLALPFNGRGGGFGVWKRTGKDTYAYLVREDLYINGNAGGFFYADSTLHLDRKFGELCSGAPECPGAATDVRLTQFVFAPDGTISGETDLLPPNSQAITTCTRLFPDFP
jgi:Acetyltransferase (GNAT) family